MICFTQITKVNYVDEHAKKILNQILKTSPLRNRLSSNHSVCCPSEASRCCFKTRYQRKWRKIFQNKMLMTINGKESIYWKLLSTMDLKKSNGTLKGRCWLNVLWNKQRQIHRDWRLRKKKDVSLWFSCRAECIKFIGMKHNSDTLERCRPIYTITVSFLYCFIAALGFRTIIYIYCISLITRWDSFSLSFILTLNRMVSLLLRRA